MAPPAPKPCYVEGCSFITTQGLPNYDMVMKDLEMHIQCAHPDLKLADRDTGKSSAGKPDRLPRPTISEGVTEAEWLHFYDKWLRYKRSTLKDADNQTVTDQLWACCDQDLEISVYNSGTRNSAKEAELISAIKKLAVRGQNTTVNTVKFLDMVQDQGETAGAFAARLRGQASICNFSISCTATGCIQEVCYADPMIRHQLIRGLADHSIQEQVLAHGAENENFDLSKTLKFIEAKEAGKRSSTMLTEAGGISKISEFQRRKLEAKNGDKTSGMVIENKKCGWCGMSGHGSRSSRQVRKEKCKAYNHICETCSSVGHYGSMCKSSKKKELSTLSELETASQGSFCNLNSGSDGRISIKALPHTAFDEIQGWKTAKPPGHPKVQVDALLCLDGYRQLKIPIPATQDRKIKVVGLPDTGAQLTVSGRDFVKKLGVKESELIPLSHGVSVANNAGLGLIGGALVTFSGMDKDRRTRETKHLVYMAKLGLFSDNVP